MSQRASPQRELELELAPSPAALIESLRDMGYSLRTALADVIDNSITAGARRIQILADTHVDRPAIGVLDNGCGMSWGQLREAMRPGTRSPLEVRDDTDLGRFGLGLKTASFSQCRRVTVVTQHQGETSCARWDLDSVAANDRWLIEIPDDVDEVRWSECLRADGTLVVWEKLDRLVEASERSDLVRQLDDAAKHLTFVFHRFLAGRHKIRLSMNDNQLEPFDPFHTNHPATQHHPIERMRLGGRRIRIRPVTLPHHDKVSTAEWQRYAGPEGYVSNQGFYLYRNRRLIVHGTWFRLTRKQELTKLARIGIDIPNTMDAEWKIDVKKASAQPPPAVRKRLAKIVERMVEGSRRTYRGRGTRQASSNRLPVWIRRQNKSRISYDIATDYPAIKALREGLSPGLGAQYDRVLRLVAAALPVESLHHDVSAHPEAVRATPLAVRDLRLVVSTMCGVLRERGLSRQAIKEWMRSAEPFSVQWRQTEPIITDVLGDHDE